MILALPADVRRRLADIEESEGIPPVEIARQAVAVWSILTADERRIIGIAALQMVVERLKGGCR